MLLRIHPRAHNGLGAVLTAGNILSGGIVRYVRLVKRGEAKSPVRANVIEFRSAFPCAGQSDLVNAVAEPHRFKTGSRTLTVYFRSDLAGVYFKSSAAVACGRRHLSAGNNRSGGIQRKYGGN